MVSHELQACEENLIDFVGIGASRSGTSWIAACLYEHPDVLMPVRKELHFFNRSHFFTDDHRLNPNGLEILRKVFLQNQSELIQGEFTPRYMIDENALLRIRTNFPRSKILIALRDPVERAFSQFCFFRFNMKKENEPDFLRALNGYYQEDYLTKSLYYQHMVNILRIFDRENLHVMIFEDISTDPEKVISSLYRFLGASASFRPSVLNMKVNQAGVNQKEPPYLWASVVKFIINSDNNLVRKYRAKLRQIIYRVNSLIDDHPYPVSKENFLERIHNIHVERQEKPRLERSIKRLVFEKYFKEDVANLERLLSLDLQDWKEC
jgi:hypothetical protein